MARTCATRCSSASKTTTQVARAVFKADFAIWVDARGRVTKAELLKSSGDAKRDARIIAILEATNDLDPPPASITFPARISVQGRKSSI